MNETIALRQFPRYPDTIAADLNAARYIRDQFLKLSMEYVNCDLRPIIVINGTMQPRDLAAVIPQNLRSATEAENLRIANLERELHEAVAMHQPR